MVGSAGRLKQRLVRLERERGNRDPKAEFSAACGRTVQEFGVAAALEVADSLEAGETTALMQRLVRYTLDLGADEPLPAWLPLVGTPP